MRKPRKKPRLYRIFDKMKSRCYNPNSKDYPHYGGRGIKIMWENFAAFKKDMEESYLAHVEEFGEQDTTIDRIDVNGNYCKENCRWSTRREQVLNRHFKNGNIPCEDGTTMSVTRYCELNGISRHRLEYLAKKYNKPMLDILHEMHIDKEYPDPEIMYEGNINTIGNIYEYGGKRYLQDDLIKELGIVEDSLFKQRMSAYNNNLEKVILRWYKELCADGGVKLCKDGYQ